MFCPVLLSLSDSESSQQSGAGAQMRAPFLRSLFHLPWFASHGSFDLSGCQCSNQSSQRGTPAADGNEVSLLL